MIIFASSGIALMVGEWSNGHLELTSVSSLGLTHLLLLGRRQSQALLADPISQGLYGVGVIG